MKLRGHDARRRASTKAPESGCASVACPATRAASARCRRVAETGQGWLTRRSRGSAGALGRAPIEAADGELTLTSEDGNLVFRLRRIDGRIHMERTRRRAARSTTVVQVSNFGDEASFIAWCEGDRLRFTYPLLFVNLRRIGRALFNRPE